jgi:hypothetical protein
VFLYWFFTGQRLVKNKFICPEQLHLSYSFKTKNMSEIVSIINKCKKDIVCKLLGSDKFELSYSQLHKLSDEIFEATNISISHSTLKRIFKDDYSSSPQLTTLDAFAKYLGYTDWNNYFKANINTLADSTKNEKKQRKHTKKTLLLIISIVGLSALAFLGYKYNFFITPNYDRVEFSYDDFNIDEMPVMVHFKYDLKNIKFKEANIQPISIYGWDNPDKIQIKPKDSTARYIYQWYANYTPRLVIDGKEVKQLKINLKTHTWKAYISNSKAGFYIKHFTDKEIYSEGSMSFTDNVLNRNNFPRNDVETVGFCLYKDFENITGDSLHFKVRFKNIPITRHENSGGMLINLLFENANIEIPLEPMKDPFRDLFFVPFENALGSKSANLSFLYLDLEKWNTLEIKTGSKKFNLFINDSLMFQSQYKTDPGQLTGINLMFGGMGEVDYVQFYNMNNELIYNEDFD